MMGETANGAGPMLPAVSVDDLMRHIGELSVTVGRQGALINQQAARIAELEASEVVSAPVAVVGRAGD